MIDQSGTSGCLPDADSVMLTRVGAVLPALALEPNALGRRPHHPCGNVRDADKGGCPCRRSAIASSVLPTSEEIESTAA
ncbi:hypothetical protein ABH926_000914 [Catenulispora sp. GP43]|uniref:hypothetical protein n=1 Tax=Catenulispora sp. GP43 TaxID=3156263 RepID=UPI003515995F